MAVEHSNQGILEHNLKILNLIYFKKFFVLRFNEVFKGLV